MGQERKFSAENVAPEEENILSTPDQSVANCMQTLKFKCISHRNLLLSL